FYRNPQLFEHALEVWSQKTGLFCSTGYIPVVPLQGAHDKGFFQCLNRLAANIAFNLFQLLQTERHIASRLNVSDLRRCIGQFKVILANNISFCQDYCPFNRVFQLANIPWKRIVFKQGKRIRFNAADLLPDLFGVFSQKVGCKKRNVPFALPQWGQFNRDDIQTEIEILPERSFRDHRFQVQIGGSHQMDINVNRLSTADRGDLPLLQNPQEFCLSGETEVGDFVQEQGSAVRNLEKSHLRLDSSGKRSLDMAKQFTLKQILGKRSTINSDKGMIPTGAVLVDRTCDQFLTGSALAGNQHSAVGRSHLHDPAIDLLNLATFAHKIIESVVAYDLFLEIQFIQHDRTLLQRKFDLF